MFFILTLNRLFRQYFSYLHFFFLSFFFIQVSSLLYIIIYILFLANGFISFFLDRVDVEYDEEEEQQKKAAAGLESQKNRWTMLRWQRGLAEIEKSA